MRLLDRYLLRELLEPFLFGLVAFTLILASSMVMFELVRAVVFQGLTLWVAGKIFLLRLPEVMVYVLPMATLLAALLGFGRLSHDSEVVALRSGGVGLRRMMVPVFFFGVAVSLATLLLSEKVVPESNLTAEMLLIQAAIEKPRTAQSNLFAPEYEKGELRRVVFVRQAILQKFNGIILWEFRNQQLIHVMRAKWGEWNPKEHSWVFHEGTLYPIAEDGEYQDLVHFKEQRVSIRYSPEELGVQARDPKLLSLGALQKLIQVKSKMGERVRSLWIQFHQKIAIPFASLAFALLGAPLGLKPRRASSSIGLGLSILIIFGYYIAMFFSMAMGETGFFPAWLSAWLPNILGVGIAGYLIQQAS